MRLTPALTILAVTAITLAWPAFAGHAEPRTTPRVLDTLRADYLEDEQTGRRLAELRVRLVTTGDVAVLHVHIAATGDRIDPVPSFRGVHGANHVTARDLSELTRTDRLKILAMPRRGTGHRAGKRFGTVVPDEPGRIPERRLLPDGTVRLDVLSVESYRLGVACTSPPLAEGEHEVYVEAKGIPRLRIDVRVGPPRDGSFEGAILDLTCLGGHNVRLSR